MNLWLETRRALVAMDTVMKAMQEVDLARGVGLDEGMTSEDFVVGTEETAELVPS